MSQNQFLKYLINVNIQNRNVAFYALVGIIHARKEVSKYHYSLFIFLSNNTIYIKNTNNFTCKERGKKILTLCLALPDRVTGTLLCTLYTTTFDVRSPVFLCEKILCAIRMSIALDKKFMPLHITHVFLWVWSM